jgi:hypothetical protein
MAEVLLSLAGYLKAGLSPRYPLILPGSELVPDDVV